MSMSNTMICGATKIWYYVPESRSAAFEAWLEATRPGYIENLEAGNAHLVATGQAIVLLQVAVNNLFASPSVYDVPAQDVCCSIDRQREGALKAYGMIMHFT